MTRSATAWLNGDVMAGLAWHAFGPMLLVIVGFVAAGLVLPERVRCRSALVVGRFEQQTGITTVVVLLVFVYWGARLVGFFAPPAPL